MEEHAVLTVDRKTSHSSEGVESDSVRTLFAAPSHPSVAICEDHIVSLIMARRGRDAIFGKDLFSDPAWDILLELYAAHLAERTMFASDLGVSIGTPLPTAVRWISALEDRGFVKSERELEPGQTAIRLTAEGASRMKRLADQWGTAFVRI